MQRKAVSYTHRDVYKRQSKLRASVASPFHSLCSFLVGFCDDFHFFGYHEGRIESQTLSLIHIFPRELSRMTRLALQGDFANALTIHHRFTEVFSLLFVDGNPAGVKAMLLSLIHI